jgi:hypothetical protein
VGVGNNNFLVLVSKQGPCFPLKKPHFPAVLELLHPASRAPSPAFPFSFESWLSSFVIVIIVFIVFIVFLK